MSVAAMENADGYPRVPEGREHIWPTLGRSHRAHQHTANGGKTRTQARTHTRARTHTHTHTHFVKSGPEVRRFGCCAGFCCCHWLSGLLPKDSGCARGHRDQEMAGNDVDVDILTLSSYWPQNCPKYRPDRYVLVHSTGRTPPCWMRAHLGGDRPNNTVRSHCTS
jgi:hypothetical protein